jgi:hypothetical protein
VAGSGTLSFAPGTTTQTITVTINGDTAFEGNETFVVNLSVAANALISDAQASGTITNNDPATLTGNWIGRSPTTGFSYDDGTCSQDIDFGLTQAGSALSGSVDAATVTSGTCARILSQDQTSGQFSPSSIVGTVTGSAVSLAIYLRRTLSGVPLQATAILASGTFDANNLTTTGTIVGPRTWTDFNGNSFPDCDFTVLTANGECGSAATPRAITLRGTRATPIVLMGRPVNDLMALNRENDVSSFLTAPISRRDGTGSRSLAPSFRSHP